MKHLITLLLFIVPFISSAQSKNEKIPKKIRKSPTALAIYLTHGIKDKQEKIDTIYSWITRNIIYDYKKFSSGELFHYENTAKILKSNEATCSGYCNLLTEMLRAINIRSEIVYGYVRTELRDTFVVPTISNHAWASILTNGEWHLVDPTWDAGYIGGVPTNKIEKFKAKWEKHNNTFDKKEEKIQTKAEEKPKKEEKFNQKLTKIKEKRYKKSVKLTRKERNTKDFKSEQGFVPYPGKSNYMVSPDSFLVSHLPANPMWQLRKDTISVSSFARTGKNINSIPDDGIEGNYPFESAIRKYTQLDYLEKLEWAGDDALAYNPKNHSTKGVNGYNTIVILTDEDFQEDAPDKYSMSSYKSLIPLTDTVKVQLKKAYKLEKEGYKVIANDFKKTYKLEKVSWKDQTKLVYSGLKMNEDMVEDLDYNIKKIRKYGENVYKIKNKIGSRSSVSSLKNDASKVAVLTDSLNRIINRFESKETLWKESQDTSYLQPLFDSLWLCAGILNAKNSFLQVKNYGTYETIKMFDERVDNEVFFMAKIYSDSLPIEMLSPSFYADIKEMYAFLSYADEWLSEKNETVQFENLSTIKRYYKSRVAEMCERYIEMAGQAYGHNKWMKINLKTFEKYWKDAEKYVAAQEELIEERNQSIMEVVDTNHKRNIDGFKKMREDAKEWKAEFKESR